MLMLRFPFYVCLLLSTTCLNFILFLKILILLLLLFIIFFLNFYIWVYLNTAYFTEIENLLLKVL